MKQNGDTVAGKKIEIVRKDVGGINPPVAKRLAQELITRDNVDILAGFVLTPNAMAAGDISADAKKFMVVMNAATAIITTKSPYMARTSLTIPQLNEAFGKWVASNKKLGVKKVYTMVSDYGPGHDAEQSFQRASRMAAARSSAPCAWRWPIPISPLMCKRPRISIRKASSSSSRAARNPARSARRSPNAASIPRRPRSWASSRSPTSMRSRAWVTPLSASSHPAHYDYNHKSKMNEDFRQSL